MASKGLKVKKMEENKMEEFYSFTNEDLPDLVSLLKKKEEMVMQRMPEPDGKEKRPLFLLCLVVELLADTDGSRKLKNTFKRMRKDKKKIIEGFVKIVEEWLKENNGKGNLLEMINVLRSHGHLNLASLVEEEFLLRYSLPSSEDGSSHEVNVYSLSRDFLLKEENKDTSVGSVPLWNANPVEQALQNTIILGQMFKELNASDQKMFRLVTPTWMKETFSDWRRSSILQVHVITPIKKMTGISMISFVKLLQIDLKANVCKRKVKNGESNHQLSEHPFRRYQLSYQGQRDWAKEFPLSCGNKEVRFWKLCGPNVEDLEIKNARFGKTGEISVEKICEGIFLDVCPKLKRFKISSSCCIDFGFRFNKKSMLKNNADKKKNGKVASNLHTLAVEVHIEEEADIRNILFLCPNLKTLILHTLWENVGALLSPTSNGECVKLETLIIKDTGFGRSSEDQFLPLRNYAEMLIEKGFNCLQHLALKQLHLTHARSPPFSLYAALAKFGESLKTLELMMTAVVPNANDMAEDLLWIADLSPFAFPNLTALKLCCDVFDYYGRCQTKRVQFDFGMLKGMPKLESFEYRVENAETFARNPGTQDWVFAGNRNAYLPEGIIVDYSYSEDEPISCKNLKQFTFFGWSLNKEDIKLVSDWFPNLTHIKAAVELDLVSLLLEGMTRLEKLDLETKRMISLGDLRRFKEKKNGLRICQTISGKSRQCLEMKEQNGRLYFAQQNSE